METEKFYEDLAQWESRELGADETFARKSAVTGEEMDAALGLKPISIRLQQGMIDDLKAIAALHGIGYQPLIKQILARFIESEQKMLANELIRSTLEEREKQQQVKTHAA
ncbi:MAG: hypothetical protein Q4A84_03675 [Neisseria sp.]|uniref:hypothetical protein n=1 Tax=Neisseria sp. TaxID=192066 RepID=UPI0026DC08F6|nr:hypothetical protein [Neisseria sp.]MDO4640789.1 hypothetical protein [Neisseria sp.]